MSKTNKALINVTTGAGLPSYYGNLPIAASFIHGDHEYIVVTPEQAKAFETVIERQGSKAYQTCEINHYDPCVLVKFDHILIGIEPDGYAHS